PPKQIRKTPPPPVPENLPDDPDLPEQPVPARAPTDAEAAASRKAALAIIKAGGHVGVGFQLRQSNQFVMTAEQLPAQPFFLAQIMLHNVDVAALFENLAELKVSSVFGADLMNCVFKQESVQFIANLPYLQMFHASGQSFTDDSLKCFA